MDTFRRIVRKFLNTDSCIYKQSAFLLDFLSTIKSDGFKTWRNLRVIEEGKQGDPPESISLKSLKYPVFLRPGTPDVHLIINNIIRREYGQMKPVNNPVWMIDAGAYIGDTSAYFLSMYPDLKIIALEPDPASFNIAERNLIPYGERVVLMQKGLYSNEMPALFSGSGPSASIGQMGFKIDCISIPAILKQFSIPHLDILKMDIEGAEESIFQAHPEEWLDRVDLLIIEIHGSSLLAPISHILSANGFSMKQYRSVWYCRSL